jgi:hypothetical protein
MIDIAFTSVGEAIRTLRGIAHYTPMLTCPTRVFLRVKLRLVGVALAGRQCGMAASPNHVLAGLRLRGLTAVSGPHV